MNISQHLEKMKLDLLKMSSIPHMTTLCHNNGTLLSHKSAQWLYFCTLKLSHYLVHTLNIDQIQRLIFTISVNLSFLGIYICISVYHSVKSSYRIQVFGSLAYISSESSIIYLIPSHETIYSYLNSDLSQHTSTVTPTVNEAKIWK